MIKRLVHFLIRFHLMISTKMAYGEREKNTVKTVLYNEYINHYIFQMKMTNSSWASTLIQNEEFPLALSVATKVMIFIIPELNTVNGGILSIFSIATQMRNIKDFHGYEVVVMTRKNLHNHTYFHNTKFRNYENIFRFDQIFLMEAAKTIMIHIPECFVSDLLDLLSEEKIKFYFEKVNLQINILNQNVEQMPSPRIIQKLSSSVDSIGQSLAFHKSCNQQYCDYYNLPTILLPAYTDLSTYVPSKFKDKEKIIIYSNDDATYKADVLQSISRNCPDFELVEIKNITFDEYMNLATRCMFSISFGEGFDGYIAQPIFQGGIGFAVYNETFFPSEDFLNKENIFKDSEDMTRSIGEKIRILSSNQLMYERVNELMIISYSKFYNLEEYKNQIKKLSIMDYDYYPTSV